MGIQNTQFLLYSLLAFGVFFLQHHGLSLDHYEDFFLDSVSASGCEQSLRGLMEWFEAETETSVMHRNQRLRAKLQESLHRLFWIHVDFAASWRFIRANWKQRHLNVITVADFLEPGKISAVAAMKNRASVRRDDKSAKIAMRIGKESGTPVMAWRQRNFQWA